MYVLQEKPDDSYMLKNGYVHEKPIATLKDEHGGVSHITSDDGCIVLVQQVRHRKSDGERGHLYCIWATHWYPEALQALRKLMDEGIVRVEPEAKETEDEEEVGTTPTTR